MRPLRLLLLVGLLALFGAGRLAAHNAPGSAVLLDFFSDRVGAELRLPLSELEFAFRAPLLADPSNVVARYRDALAVYVAQHVVVRAPDGRPWTVSSRAMHVALGEQPIDLVVHLDLRPPSGAPLRKFTLAYDVIAHEVMNHIVLVSLRSDWNHARLGNHAELLGTIRSFASELSVDRTDGSPWQGFRRVLTLGLHHIAEGTDHLLFLFALLLPAPLLAHGRRWSHHGGLRHSVTGLFKIVTAFTVGHSLTLLAGAVGWLRLPSQPVEVLVAVSIFVSAVHAIRPIFPGREAVVAACFGLVHGLAFASVLAPFQLDRPHFAAALLAFNLGIELMQLCVVALTIPWLVLLSRSPLYTPARLLAAIFALLASLGWIGERAFGWTNPFDAGLNLLADHAVFFVIALAVVALVAGVWPRLRKAPQA